MKDARARPTLSYANINRPWLLYEAIFYQLSDHASMIAGRQKSRFKFKNPFRRIDASTIDLCLEVFDWAKFRQRKGAVKLHLMLDHHGCLPPLALDNRRLFLTSLISFCFTAYCNHLNGYVYFKLKALHRSSIIF